ncbi:hypothetical protein RRG08_062374 [Elysia crispata]|uniref:Uncharacterized protein n=1 Tax=Elysia crispata TaxID=231223 RepID=A0AAE1CY52_9GAST|nr:hypothetical protein RRG08_062374 [Elysia crispata]
MRGPVSSGLEPTCSNIRSSPATQTMYGGPPLDYHQVHHCSRITSEAILNVLERVSHIPILASITATLQIVIADQLESLTYRARFYSARAEDEHSRPCGWTPRLDHTNFLWSRRDDRRRSHSALITDYIVCACRHAEYQGNPRDQARELVPMLMIGSEEMGLNGGCKVMSGEDKNEEEQNFREESGVLRSSGEEREVE